MCKQATIVCLIVVAVTLLTQSECFSLSGLFTNKIISPMGHLSPFKKNKEDNAEHGHLDGLGRDIIRETSRTFGQIKEGLRFFSKNTKGLDCNKTLSEGKMDTFKSNVQAIYPGTKWCGDGNISTFYDDLGKFSTTDKCCREHDLCPQNIPANGEKFGLVNTGLFTRSDCECDLKFYHCLKNAGGIVAESIGYTYFTVLGPQCFKRDYPVQDCAAEKRGRCSKYVTNKRAGKKYQWFDNPAF